MIRVDQRNPNEQQIGKKALNLPPDPRAVPVKQALRIGCKLGIQEVRAVQLPQKLNDFALRLLACEVAEEAFEKKKIAASGRVHIDLAVAEDDKPIEFTFSNAISFWAIIATITYVLAIK